MNIQQVSVSFFSEPVAGPSLDLDGFIELFHEWIREDRVEDQVPIDVADYRHVPGGPGVLLVTHHGHFVATRDVHRRLSLGYARKRDEPGPVRGRLREALRQAARAVSDVARDPRFADRVRFRADEVRVQVVSRLVAPAEPAVHERLTSLLGEALDEAWGGVGATLRRDDDPRRPFGVTAAFGGPVDFEALRTLVD